MDLLEPTPLAEFYLVIRPDGSCRLADSKLDTYEPDLVRRIWVAAVTALTDWAARHGAPIGLIIGDGGPDYVRLKARLYEQAEELATLRIQLERSDG